MSSVPLEATSAIRIGRASASPASSLKRRATSSSTRWSMYCLSSGSMAAISPAPRPAPPLPLPPWRYATTAGRAFTPPLLDVLPQFRLDGCHPPGPPPRGPSLLPPDVEGEHAVGLVPGHQLVARLPGPGVHVRQRARVRGPDLEHLADLE